MKTKRKDLIGIKILIRSFAIFYEEEAPRFCMKILDKKAATAIIIIIF